MSWYASVDIPWHVHHEHQLSAAYHWTIQEIDQTAARDCICHLILTRRNQAVDRHWLCTASSFADITESDRRMIMRDLKRQMETGNRRLSEYEVVDPTSRIIMLGNSLRIHGDRWIERHLHELAWLDQQGISRQFAIDKSLEWEAKQMADEFWKPKPKA